VSRASLRAAAVVAVATLIGPGAAWALARNEVAASRIPGWIVEQAAVAVPASDADLVWLLAEAFVEPLPEGGVRVRERRVARVLREDGLRRLGTWYVPYHIDDVVETVEVHALNPDGRWRKARKDDRDIVEHPAPQSLPGYTASRYWEANTPQIAVGSLVAFESSVVEAIDRGAQDWIFGDPDAPTTVSRARLAIPPGWSGDAVLARGEDLAVRRDDDGVTVEARDLSRLPREERRPSAREILPVAHLRWRSPSGDRGFADWAEVGRWYRSVSESKLAEAGEAVEIADRLAPSGPDDVLAAISRAFDFVSRDVRYVAIEIGIGGYVPHAPAEVVRTRYGDCKDKAFLLRAVLERWGLRTFPVIVRTRGLGPLEPGAPGIGAFNHLIAAVALPEGVGADLWATVEIEGIGRVAFLDGTSREGDAWSLPVSDQGTAALLVLPDGGRLVDLPVQPPAAASIRRELDARVIADGSLERASLVETYDGTSAIWKRDAFVGRSAEERDRIALEFVQDRFPGVRLDGWSMEGLDDTGVPFLQRYDLSGGAVGKKVGTFLVLEPSKWIYDVVAERLPPPPRRWELELSSPHEEIATLRIEIPEGWAPEELPAPVDRRSPEIEFEADWSFQDGVLVHRRTSRLKVDRVPADRYEAFREFVLEARGAVAQGILLVRR